MTTATSERVWTPEEPQAFAARQKDVDEVLVGGAKGGGKSDFLLAFQVARRHKYTGTSGLILRRELADLHREGGLIPRSQQWLRGLANWNAQRHKWTFPNGSVLEFGHCQAEDDAWGYASSEYADICFEQLEQFTEFQYKIIRGSLRTTRRDLRPLVRCSANPGGVGHLWVKNRFIDAMPPRTVYRDPETGLTRMFVAMTYRDNPHLGDAYVQTLNDLPEPWRTALRDGRWDIFVGQYFAEWTPEIHVCRKFDPPKGWRRFGMLDYGFAKPFCYLQIALSPDGVSYPYRELYQSRVLDTDQAGMIAEACSGDVPEYVVAGPDLWHETGKGPKGQSSAETYAKVWKDRSFKTRLLMADDDRLTGWRRVREWLKPFVGGNGDTTALLQVMEGACPNLVRTLPGLVHDEHRLEDCDTDGEDHAPDALRYGLMSRPEPRRVPQPPPVPLRMTAEQMLKHLERQRRQRLYIGGKPS